MRPKNATRWFIYRMRCLVPGVGDYIGMSCDPFRREKEHKGKRRGSKLTAAIMLYGEENFTYEIIDTTESEQAARRAEAHYIRELGTGWPKGLNVVHAGEGVYADQYEKRRKAQILAWDDEERRRRHSERLKRAMNTQTAKERNSEAAYRRWSDPKYRAKQSASSTGKKHTEETKQRLREIKLAASAARGGPKKKKLKYPGLTASEIGRINLMRPDVKAKIRATREKNKEKIAASNAPVLARLNGDPEIQRKRTEGLRRYYATHSRPPTSEESRRKMSESAKIRHLAKRALMFPEGRA